MKFTKAALSYDDANEVIKALPHGSGIDCVWRYEFSRGRHRFTNAYHMMTEHGYYCGFQDFQVEIFFHNKTVLNPLSGPRQGKIQVVHRKGDLDFDVKSIGGWCHMARHRLDLKNYLTETIGYSLREIVPVIRHDLIDAE